MKIYPSIPKTYSFLSTDEPLYFYIFDKLDGSNLRISWTKKKGWYDFSTRTRSISTSHPLYGKGYQYFITQYKEQLEAIIKTNKWIKVDFFFEFHGPNSFAGRHDDNDELVLTLIDVAVNNGQLMPPSTFINTFNHLPIPNYLGLYQWNDAFISMVKYRLLEGITFEGVVGKSSNLIYLKAKTNDWLLKVKSKFNEKDALIIINS